MDVFWYGTYMLFLSGGLAIAVTALFALAAVRGVVSVRAAIVVGAVFATWPAAIVSLGASGIAADDTGGGPPLGPLVAGVATFMGLLLLWRSGPVRATVLGTALQWIVLLQLVRLAGGVFVVAYGQGHFPPYWGLTAGLGDALTGLGAALVAWGIVRGARWWRPVFWVWTVVGVADVLHAMGAGAMLLEDDQFSLLSSFPFILIAGFAAPMGLILHAAAIMRVRRMAPPAAGIT